VASAPMKTSSTTHSTPLDWDRAWSEEIGRRMAEVAGDCVELLDAGDVHGAPAEGIAPRARPRSMPIASSGHARAHTRRSRWRNRRARSAATSSRAAYPHGARNGSRVISRSRDRVTSSSVASVAAARASPGRPDSVPVRRSLPPAAAVGAPCALRRPLLRVRAAWSPCRRTAGSSARGPCRSPGTLEVRDGELGTATVVSAAVGHSSPTVTKRFQDHYVRRSFSPKLRAGLGLGQKQEGRVVPMRRSR